MATSAAFKSGPTDNKDAWEYVHKKIVNADGSLNYDGIESLHGHHCQHVFNVALQMDMQAALVDDSAIHPATRAHFRAAVQLGAGALFTIDLITKEVMARPRYSARPRALTAGLET